MKIIRRKETKYVSKLTIDCITRCELPVYTCQSKYITYNTVHTYFP